MIKQIMPLSLIIGLRFFGLFIVLPMLSIYAINMQGATAFLAGVVVGGYALTQAFFQVPFGLMSDNLGRKKTLLVGLIIFILGSIVSALATDIYTLLIGRLLQGAGAIGSVVSAMIADLVKEEERPKAMGVMGGTIALSFALAMIISPIIGGAYGIDMLFYITAILSFFAIIILFTIVPNPPKIVHSYSEEESKMRDVFKDKALVKMYITFLFHSSIMTMAFFIIPLVMTNSLDNGGFGWEKQELWKVYLIATIFGILAMGPSAVFGEKYGKGKEIFLISISLIFISFLLMGFASSSTIFIIGVVLFFMGFNMFEPLLQSFVSKFAKVHQKGAALGVANTFAYIGIFLGGIIAGLVMQYSSREILAIVVSILSIVWFIWVLSMQNPHSRKNLYISLDKFNREMVSKVLENSAIVECYINETEKIAVIKYEKEEISQEEIEQLIQNL